MKPDASLQSFLDDTLGVYEWPQKLQGDASTREYFRVRSGGSSFIICRDTALNGIAVDAYPFMIVYSLYRRHHIPVPEVYRVMPDKGLLLLQDLGDSMLETEFPRMSAGASAAVYHNLLDIMVRIHSIKKGEKELLPFSLSFDREKLMQEFDFFIEHALKGYFGVIEDAVAHELRVEFTRISDILDVPQHFVLNHRDFHSRNIMLPAGVPYIIDFQDSRMGLPVYDLASLLRDSYTGIGDNELKNLKDYYYHLSRENGVHGLTPGEFDYYFTIMAFQRNVKALGTFGYQITVMKRPHYERFIQRTLGYLGAYGDTEDVLRKAVDLLRSCVGGAP